MALSGPPDNVPQLDHAHLKVLESYESCGADPWPFGRKVVDHARGGAGGGRGGGLGRAGACAGPCTGTPTHATRRRRAVEPRRTARPRRGCWGAGLGPIGAGHARRNKAGPSGRAPHDDRHVRDPLPTWRLRIAPTSARPVPGVSASGFALSRRRRRTTRYNFRARVPTRGTAAGAAPQHAQCAGPGGPRVGPRAAPRARLDARRPRVSFIIMLSFCVTFG